MVCLLFISFKITMHQETACGCWNIVPPRNALGGCLGLLGLLSLSQSTGVPGAPRNHWLELISKILFSCCFPLCPFPPGCCSRLALLGCRNLVPRFCRPRRCELGNHQELAVHLWLWPLIPLRASCPGSGNGTQNWGTRRNLQVARTSWCPITKSSTWFLRKNSTALRFYQNPPHISSACHTNDNSKHLAKFLDPRSDPKTCGAILLCCSSRTCQLLLSN